MSGCAQASVRLTVRDWFDFLDTGQSSDFDHDLAASVTLLAFLPRLGDLVETIGCADRGFEFSVVGQVTKGREIGSR